MNYINTGFLETDIEFEKDLEQALQEHGIRFSEYNAPSGKTATFSLDDVEGFIEKDLERTDRLLRRRKRPICHP